MTKREKKYHRQKKAGYGFRSRTCQWDESDQAGMIAGLFNTDDKNSPFYVPPGDHFSNFGLLIPQGVEKNPDGSAKEWDGFIPAIQ